MKAENVTIGLEVVRAKGDYVVGRTGNVLAIDWARNRAQVSWGSWVSFNAIEPTSIPYEIVKGYYDEKRGKTVYPKYRVK